MFGERLVSILFSLDSIRANMFHTTYPKGHQFCCALTLSPFPRRRIRPHRPVHTNKTRDFSVKSPNSAQSPHQSFNQMVYTREMKLETRTTASVLKQYPNTKVHVLYCPIKLTFF